MKAIIAHDGVEFGLVVAGDAEQFGGSLGAAIGAGKRLTGDWSG
jgi:hypothetical protein